MRPSKDIGGDIGRVVGDARIKNTSGSSAVPVLRKYSSVPVPCSSAAIEFFAALYFSLRLDWSRILSILKARVIGVELTLTITLTLTPTLILISRSWNHFFTNCSPVCSELHANSRELASFKVFAKYSPNVHIGREKNSWLTVGERGRSLRRTIVRQLYCHFKWIWLKSIME